jgi:hypothetical protein
MGNVDWSAEVLTIYRCKQARYGRIFSHDLCLLQVAISVQPCSVPNICQRLLCKLVLLIQFSVSVDKDDVHCSLFQDAGG